MVGCVRSTERGQGMLRLGLSVHMLGAADRWVMGCPRQAGCSRGRSTRDKRAEGLDKLPRWPDRPSYQDLVADSFPRQLGRPDVQLLCSACERAVLKANRRATETAGQRPGSWSRPRRRQAARRGRRADPGRRAPAERRHPDCRSTRAVLVRYSQSAATAERREERDRVAVVYFFAFALASARALAFFFSFLHSSAVGNTA